MLIVGVDFDGVLCDIMSPWLESYNILYDDNLTTEDIHSWEVSRYLKCSQQDFFDLRTPEMYNVAQELPFASFSMRMLLEYTGILFVCISNDSEEFRYAKEAWLMSHGINIPLVLERNKWGELDTAIRINMLIDDNPKNAPSVLFDQPWNQGHSGLRVYSWPHFLQLFTTVLKSQSK
jgi:5'(3')-deoxyribonucleotidase